MSDKETKGKVETRGRKKKGERELEQAMGQAAQGLVRIVTESIIHTVNARVLTRRGFWCDVDSFKDHHKTAIDASGKAVVQKYLPFMLKEPLAVYGLSVYIATMESSLPIPMLPEKHPIRLQYEEQQKEKDEQKQE